MIYAGDQWIQYPVKDLYDKAIMLMSIAAARDMYEKGLKLLEDFNNKYGDFMSPIQKDMDWYNQNVTGKVRDTINNLYANGIDPLRSAEGRAAIAQLIYSMPTGDIAKLRLSAETAKEYLKSFGDDTNPELEKFLGRDLSNWSTLGDSDNPANGVWGYNKASKYQTIDDLIEPIVKNVDYTYDEAMTKLHNDGNNYYSITRDRLMLAVNDNMADILATPSGAFHWELAKRAAAAQGGGEELAKSIFNNMIGNRLSDHEKVKFEADPFKLDDYRTRNDMRAHAANRAIDHKYWKLEHAGDGDGNNQNQSGYSLAKDVYSTSIAKAAGIEYLPKDGITPYDLKEMMKSGAKIQRDAIVKKGNTFDATGIFISPEKIGGLIPAVAEKDGKYILNENFINQLYELDDVRSSYGGWRAKRDKSGLASLEARLNFKNNTKTTRELIIKKISDGNFKIEVTPISDKNGNNVYPIFGEDDVFRTYSRVRVKILNDKGTPVTGGGMTAEGKEMGLKVGLHSNKGAASPDLSVSAREKLGRYPFDDTKKEIGLTGNADWPFGTNILK